MKQNLVFAASACVFMALCSTHGNQLAAAENPMNIRVPLIISDPRMAKAKHGSTNEDFTTHKDRITQCVLCWQRNHAKLQYSSGKLSR